MQNNTPSLKKVISAIDLVELLEVLTETLEKKEESIKVPWAGIRQTLTNVKSSLFEIRQEMSLGVNGELTQRRTNDPQPDPRQGTSILAHRIQTVPTEEGRVRDLVGTGSNRLTSTWEDPDAASEYRFD